MKIFYQLSKILIGVILSVSVNNSFSQSTKKYDEVLKNVNLNLELNYDSTFFLEHDYTEIIFDKNSILRNIDIEAYSYESGRFDPLKKGSRMEIQSFYKNAVIYNTDAEIYFRDLGQYTLSSVPNRKKGNDFKELRCSIWIGQILKFNPNERSNYKLQVIQNEESIKDTMVNGVPCFKLRRILNYTYSNKRVEKWSKYSVLVITDLLINNHDYAVIHRDRFQELKNDTNNLSFKTKISETFEKVGSHYFRSDSYFLVPRYQPNHIVDYNDDNLYTLIIKKSKIAENSIGVETLRELPFAPYNDFCTKSSLLGEKTKSKYEEARKFTYRVE